MATYNLDNRDDYGTLSRITLTKKTKPATTFPKNRTLSKNNSSIYVFMVAIELIKIQNPRQKFVLKVVRLKLPFWFCCRTCGCPSLFRTCMQHIKMRKQVTLQPSSEWDCLLQSLYSLWYDPHPYRHNACNSLPLHDHMDINLVDPSAVPTYIL